MRTLITSLAVLAATSAAGAAQAASVELKDAVARVSVIPEARADVKVEIIRSNPALPLQVRREGGRTIIDGDLGRRINDCRVVDNRFGVRVRGIDGWVDHDEIPQVLIRVPRDAEVATGGAVFGSIDRSASLKLSNAGCGDWTIADVAGPMHINLAGSGDTRTGRAGSVKIHLAGSGDIHMQAIRGGMDVNLAGSGDIGAASIDGPLNVSIAGSGNVTVGGGRATDMTVNVAGSGETELRGVADSLKVRIAGSGDVKVDQVRGKVSKAIVGSGDVILARRD